MGIADEPIKPEPFIKSTTLVLLLSLIAIAVSGIAIYESNDSNTKIVKLEKKLNDTDTILGNIVLNRNAPTAFDQDVISWANQTNNRLQALEQKK